MAKLKTPGVITPEEYQQAELAGTLTIAKEIVCSYCQDPVEIQDPLQFHCQRHGWLELRMYDNPGYPAVVNEYYGTMMFFFDVIPKIPLEAHRRLLAQYKGCPFCNRNLSTKERNVDIIQQSLFCDQCRVSFRIGVVEQKMRFQPESKHFIARNATDVEIDKGHTDQRNGGSGIPCRTGGSQESLLINRSEHDCRVSGSLRLLLRARTTTLARSGRKGTQRRY